MDRLDPVRRGCTTDLPVREVLLFDDPDHPGRLRMHRMVRISDDDVLITRGDANPQDDSTRSARAAVRGVRTLRIPLIGLSRVWLGERNLTVLVSPVRY